jgi:hypothetical protein
MSSINVDRDIGVYVEHRLKTDPGFSGLSERIQTEIKRTITAGSHGM